MAKKSRKIVMANGYTALVEADSVVEESVEKLVLRTDRGNEPQFITISEPHRKEEVGDSDLDIPFVVRNFG